MADLGENPKQQGESSEQRKGKGKRKEMESGYNKAGNESKGKRGRRSLGRTEEEIRLSKNESDRRFRAKKKDEFLRLQTRVNELSAELERTKNMKAETEIEKNEAEAHVQMLQNLVKDMSTELQNVKAECQRMNSFVDLFLNQNGAGNPRSFHEWGGINTQGLPVFHEALGGQTNEASMADPVVKGTGNPPSFPQSGGINEGIINNSQERLEFLEALEQTDEAFMADPVVKNSDFWESVWQSVQNEETQPGQSSTQK